VTDAASEFFAELAGREHVPLLGRAKGVMRFELVHGKRTERWLVAVDRGEVEVSRANRAADCILRADRELFNRMASGEMNAFAAMLRGAVTVEGDPRLLVLFQRLLPGPPARRRRPRATAKGRRRR